MKRQPVLALLISDFAGLAGIVGLSLVLGLTANLLREKPLPLLTYRPPPFAGTIADEPLPEVTLAELQVASEHRDHNIIDVRPVEFYQRGHVPGATNVPLARLQAGWSPDGIAGNAEIVVYCQDVSCPAAKSAAQQLRRLGHGNVSVFPGGWYAWKKAGLPIETSP